MLTYILTGMIAVVIILLIILLLKNNNTKEIDKILRDELLTQRNSQEQRISILENNLSSRLDSFAASQATQAASASKSANDVLIGLTGIVETRLNSMRESNDKILEQMRCTVDEKLQKTLDDKLSASFKNVSDRLEQVHRGLGEMQTLAAGVGDLKKVMSGVKTRGILGEIQLAGVIEQILAPNQFVQNVATRPGSRDVVEFAVKLPGQGDEPVYIPIDAKFPLEAYNRLLDFYETGDTTGISSASKELETAIKKSAKDICDKYIYPPSTTDFAIMFLPVEGLYAEVVRNTRLFETVRSDYKILIAGPSTLAALLSSLQMGFKTLTIEKRASEVWSVLGSVKTEFLKFADVLEGTQKKLNQLGNDMDKLVGVRTRKIISQLDKIGEDE